VVLGLLHAWLHASVRPMFQVSDEISYLSALQIHIYMTETPGTLSYQCAAPPVGLPLHVDPGGKVLFRRGGALLLKQLCNAGVGSTTVYWLLRLVNGLTLPLLVLLTFALAREVAPAEPAVGLGAAAFVALQPIAATFAGGITPDGTANAFAALVMWLVTRQVIGTGHWWEIAPLIGATAAALTIKDTAAFLLPVSTLALVWRVWHLGDNRRWARYALAGTGAVLVPLVSMVGLRVAPPTVLASDPTLSSESWLALAGIATDNVLRQTWSLVSSTWMPLGNFGAIRLSLPDSVLVLAVLFFALMLCGLGAGVLGRRGPTMQRATQLWGMALLLCALQPGVREAVMALPDLYQGRWLFPMLPGMAVLAMLGVAHAGLRPRRVLPLQVLLLGATASVGLLLVAGHYYERFPDVVARERLFLRSSSGVLLDLDRLSLWSARPAILQQRALFLVAGTSWLLAWAATLTAVSRLSPTQEHVHD
jgi:4-amino-4-deoxy-L-arabinose transferase-like glycosyltransferase